MRKINNGAQRVMIIVANKSEDYIKVMKKYENNKLALF